MYIRWKRQRWGNKRGVEERLNAVLVVSERVNGMPRQRFLKHVGSINPRYQEYMWPRTRFWEQVDTALSTLELTSEQRCSLMQGMERVVAPLSAEEIAEIERERTSTNRRKARLR